MNKRTENKYLIERSRLPKLLKQLSKNKALYQNYNVYSLYFDDINYKSAIDHLEGTYCRSKFRFRFYTDFSGMVVNGFYFEVKSKKGDFGYKTRSVLPEFDGFIGKNCDSELIDDIFTLLKSMFHMLLKREGFDALGLEPVLLVSYKRNRYFCLHEELNIDSELKFQTFFFWQRGSQFASDNVVLEVKAAVDKMRYSISTPSLLGLNRVAFSKYIYSLQALGVINNIH